MKRYILHSPFSIYHFESVRWEHVVHKHTYFEIIFILKGSGSHHINGNTYPYEAGDVFLLGPEDYHYFEIDVLTEFSFIRFHDSIRQYTRDNRTMPWPPIVKALLESSSQSRGSIITDPHEKQKLHALLLVLEAENEKQQSQYFETIRDSLLQSMLTILARNLFQPTTSKSPAQDSVEPILRYIQQHIHEPQKLTIHHLADLFHYSPAYISLYFKKQTGESLKQYITKHKIKLIEARLIYSGFSLSQIADEFGFTDESHLCKLFRKHMGVSPGTFRSGRDTTNLPSS